MKRESQLIENDKTCWCHYCNVNILPKTRFLIIYKRAIRGTARVNICLNCLKELSESFTDDDIQECKNIKLRILASSICNGNDR